jgi:hypothetical protein
MRKFFFSLKSLMLTLALVAGGSAWAQITSLPFVADFSEAAAPFGEPAFVTGNDAIGKVVAVVNGTAEASFAVDGGAYTLGNAEEVTVSFTMFNGWLGNGTNNTFAVLNSEGVTLASLSYNANNCNVVDVTLAGNTVEGFEAFTGQGSAGAKGSNGYDNGRSQGFIANTEEAKNNGEVTIKINSFGGVSLSFVGGKGNVNQSYSATLAEGTKVDLAKLTISNGSNNGDRATGYGNLTVTSKSMVKVSQDYSDGIADWVTGNEGRYTVDMNEGGYLTVNAVGNGNNGTTITGSTVDGAAAAGEDFASSEDFTMTFDLQLTGGNNQLTWFNINDAANNAGNEAVDAHMLTLKLQAAGGTVWQVNGSETQTLDLAKATWYSFKLTKQGAKLYLTVVPTEGGDALMNQELITVTSTVGGLGNMILQTKRYYAFLAIDNVVVRDVVASEDIPATPIYNYTVKFVDQNDEEFKDSEVREQYAGVELEITDDDKATVTIGKTQYIYVSDDAAGQTAIEDGSAVVTVVYNKFTVADYTVNYFDEQGNALKDATVHKNAEVGTEVEATAGEKAQFLLENTLYSYVSGAEPLTVAEDETANVINLVFAPVEGVEAYYYQNYESATATDWTFKNGRYTPFIADGSKVADREVTLSHIEQKAKIDPETGEEMKDSLTGETIYEDVTVIDGYETVEFANKTKFLAVAQDNRNNNGTTGNSSSLGVDQANFTFEAKVLLGSANNQNNAEFIIKNFAGDANIFAIKQTNANSTTQWVLNGDAENFTVELPNSGTTTGATIDNLNYNAWYNLKVTVFKGYTFVTITDADGNEILTKALVPTTANTYGVGSMQFNTGRYNANFAIDDVLIRNVLDEDIPEGMNTIEIAINFVDEEGKSVKDSEIVELNAGDPITIRDMYKESFKGGHEEYTSVQVQVGTDPETGEPIFEEQTDTTWVDDLKYIYVSDDAEGKIAQEGEEVNIVFRTVIPGTVRVRFKTIVDGVATNQKANYATYANVFEGDVITYYYPKYQMIDGVLYTVGEDASYPYSATYEVPEFTLVNGKPVQKIVYVDLAPSTIEDAVYYNETEDIEGITVVDDTYTNIRMSNGKAGSAIGGNVLVTTLQPGVYTLTSSTRSGTTNFLAGDVLIHSVTSEGTVVTTTSEAFTLYEETPIYIEQQSKTTQYSDYVLIQKVGDIVVMISDVTLATSSEFDEEDGSIQIAVSYTPNIPEEYAEDLLEAVFHCTVYDAEGNVVTELEKQPLEITDGTFNFYLYDLEVSSTYVVTVDAVNIIDYSRMDEETFEFPTIYSYEGEMASLSFTTPDENPVGIAKVDAATLKADGKYLEKGKIVIRKAGKAYRVNGVQMK